MIGFVATPPRVDPQGGGFLVALTSGGEETTFMLTLHAMSGLCGSGMARVREAQAAQFEPTPFERERGSGRKKWGAQQTIAT